MKNLNVVPATIETLTAASAITTNAPAKAKKLSAMERIYLEMEEEATASDLAQNETPFEGEDVEMDEAIFEDMEDMEDMEDEAEATIETNEVKVARAERGTVKKATLELFARLTAGGEVKQELWAQMAVDKGICKNVRQAQNILRYDFLQIQRISNDGGTVISRVTLSVVDATAKADQMTNEAKLKAVQIVEEAKAKADDLLERTEVAVTAMLNRATENESKLANNAANEAVKMQKNFLEMQQKMAQMAAIMNKGNVEVSDELKAMFAAMGLATA